MDKKKKMDALVYMFERSGVSVDPKNIESLSNLAQETTFMKQEIILDIGQKQNYLFLILQGMARSYYIDEKGNDNANGDVFLYGYAEDEQGLPSLRYIDDDEEYEAVADRYDELLDEAFYDSIDD